MSDNDNCGPSQPAGRANATTGLLWRQPAILLVIGLAFGPGCFFYQWYHSRAPMAVVELQGETSKDEAPVLDLNPRMNPLKMRVHFAYEMAEASRGFESQFYLGLEKEGGGIRGQSVSIPISKAKRLGLQEHTVDTKHIYLHRHGSYKLVLTPTGTAKYVKLRSVKVEIWRNVQFRGWPFIVLGALCLIASAIRLCQLLGLNNNAAFQRIIKGIASIFKPIGW